MDLVAAAVADLNESLPEGVPVERGRETPLYGGNGVLDSLALVRLVLELEERIKDRYGVAVSLADERAISQKKSPFRTVGSLADYIGARLDDREAS